LTLALDHPDYSSLDSMVSVRYKGIFTVATFRTRQNRL